MIATRPARRPPAKRPPAEQVRRRPPRKPASRAPKRRSAASSPALRPLVSTGLGLLWAVLLLVAADAGTAVLAVLLVPVAVTASVSATRTAGPKGRRRRTASVELAVSAGVAAVLPLAAIAGGPAAFAAGVILALAAAGLFLLTGARVPARLLLAVFIPSVAAASAVAARSQGVSEGLTLLVAICLYDMATFVTGNGARGGPVGVVFGLLTLAVLAVFVSAVVVPPFSGHTAWVLIGLVAVLAPAGVYLVSVVIRRPLPALRRLDSLVLAGPAWVVGVGLLLHR